MSGRDRYELEKKMYYLGWEANVHGRYTPPARLIVRMGHGSFTIEDAEQLHELIDCESLYDAEAMYEANPTIDKDKEKQANKVLKSMGALK